jgi:DNA-binding beta-propeller fold protein YncE
MVDSQGKHLESKAKNRLIVIIVLLMVLTSVCGLKEKLGAQQLGSVITFQEAISTDEEGGRLYFPSFVFADTAANEVYLIDGKSRIIIFTSDFFPVYTMNKRNGIETPQGLTVDAHGKLYVAQGASNGSKKHRISVYSECLKWERDIYIEGFEGAADFMPSRLAVDQKGNLYIASNNFAGVLIVDSKGHLLNILSPDEEGRKVFINNVFIDKSGRIYLVSEDEGRIYIYDKDKNFILKFGEKGGSSGKLSRPRAIGVDNNNSRMYVVDYMRHTITVYDKEGKFLFEFGGLGWSEGWFQHPIDLAVDSEGRIIVADTFNQRVQVFNSW